jgi:hypothetical protein
LITFGLSSGSGANVFEWSGPLLYIVCAAKKNKLDPFIGIQHIFLLLMITHQQRLHPLGKRLRKYRNQYKH